MKKKFMCLLMNLASFLSANIGPQGFGLFENYYFVETGAFVGDGLHKAIVSGAFKEFRSIEFDAECYQNVVRRFAHNKNVRVWHGSSADTLWDAIKDIEKTATFWLDAHIYPPIEGVQNCPLIEELEQIGRHHIKNHTILIDDMHCAGTAAFDFLTKEDLIVKILEINPNYRIFYVPGGDAGEYPENVMVAVVS